MFDISYYLFNLIILYLHFNNRSVYGVLFSIDCVSVFERQTFEGKSHNEEQIEL